MGTLEDLEAMRPLTEKIIGCAIEVHSQLGGGLLESIYESAMCIELRHQQLTFQRQPSVCIRYKNQVLGHCKADLIVERAVVVELKSVERFDPVFDAQLLTYLRCTGLRIGLLLNFRTRLLKTGIRRLVL